MTVRRAALAAVLGCVLVSGCAREPTDPPTGAVTDVLRVGLTEWTIETGGARLQPGTVEVLVTNSGATGHDVVIRGAEGTWATPVLAPGERHELVIAAVAAEELDLVCTVAGHDAAGMRTTVSVAGGGE